MIVALLLSLPFSAPSQLPGALELRRGGEPETLILEGGLVFGKETFESKTLFIEGGLFRASAPENEARVIDVSGAFIIPPLADAHTHRFAGEGDARESAELYLERGFLYAANLCGPTGSRESTLEWTNRVDGVDVLFAHGALTLTGAHPVPLYRGLHERRGLSPGTFLAENDGNTFYQFKSARDLDRRLDELLETGPDLVKFMYSPGLDTDLCEQLVERVHAAGLRAVAHLDTRASFAHAARIGVDILAHVPGYGARHGEDLKRYRLTPEDARAAFEAGMVVIPTAGAYDLARADNSAAQSITKHNLRALRDAKVTIAFGSDEWQGPDNELAALRRSGVFTNEELLGILTEVTPRVLFPDRTLGRLAPGYEASFVVLGRDPIEDLDALGSIEMVVKQGVVLYGAGF